MQIRKTMTTFDDIKRALSDYNVKEKTDHVKKHPLHFPQWIMLAPQNKIKTELDKLKTKHAKNKKFSDVQRDKFLMLLGRLAYLDMNGMTRLLIGIGHDEMSFQIEKKFSTSTDSDVRFTLAARYALLGKFIFELNSKA